MSLTRVDTDLVGNGAAPEDLLELDREAIFTRPDQTENTLTMLSVSGEQTVSSNVTLRGNLYVRASDIDTLNGDDSDFEECEDTPGFICEEEGDDEEIALDENDQPIPADDELEGATVNRTDTEQNGSGFALQADFTGDTRRPRQSLHDRRDARRGRRRVRREHRARRARRDAPSDPRRRVRRRSVHGPRNVDDEHGLLLEQHRSRSASARALTVSGRYNRTHVVLEDQLDDDLDGDHTFQRFNPAVGLTVGDGRRRRSTRATAKRTARPRPSSSPAPTRTTRAACRTRSSPIRRSSRSWRRRSRPACAARWSDGRWHAGVFRTTNDDDILFISAGALTNQGLLRQRRRDAPRRLRSSISAGAAGERLTWSLDYTYLDATFREDFAVASPNHPEAVDGEIEVESGDRLPLIPEQLLKAGLRIRRHRRPHVRRRRL